MANSLVDGWLWPAFLVGIALFIGMDLLLFNRQKGEPGFKSSLKLTLVSIGLAGAFTAWFAYRYGSGPGTQFLTGYLVEFSLSIDNLFVILLIFKAFKIPPRNQRRVLFWGIFGAVAFRGILIVAGASLVARYHWIMYVFGCVLIVSAVKFLLESDTAKDVTANPVVRFLRKHLRVASGDHGERFLVREDGKTKVTLLFLVLCLIEVTDLVFAVDSIPAVFAITQDAFIAFGSNILAILGLRSVYFVLAKWVGTLRYLKPGLAVVLAFVGTKMLIAEWVRISDGVSLGVIAGVLATAALSSWHVGRKERRAV
ncbi:MAG TPA: TerC/Alx family metal homeostasis membrane protein [Bdellovibrionota bacterium]|jgi:tellurite resistance protein TerC|nr:TerC/Alx family metal homeostasis membrane protein [Bdellovibrionota bacterium]